MSDQQSPHSISGVDLEGLSQPFTPDLDNAIAGGPQTLIEDNIAEPSRLTTNSRVYTQPTVIEGQYGLPAERLPKLVNGLAIHDGGAEHNYFPNTTTTREPSMIMPPLSELSGESKSQGKGKMVEESQSIPQSNSVSKPRKDLSVKDLNTWAQMTKASARIFGPNEQFLPYEKELIGELKKRDHVSVFEP